MQVPHASAPAADDAAAAADVDELEARTDEALLVECRHFALHNSRLRRAGALLKQLMLIDADSGAAGVS